MDLRDFDAQHAALMRAWQQLHEATDRPESLGALRALYAALRPLAEYQQRRSGQAVDTTAPAVERALAEMMGDWTERGHARPGDAEVVSRLAQTGARVKTLMRYTTDEDQEFTRLISASLPVVWRAIEAGREELRRDRPVAFHGRRLKRAALCIAPLLLGWGIWLAWPVVHARFSPRGWRVSYYNGRDFEHLRAVRGAWLAQADYGSNRPAAFVRRNNWSARWDGILAVPTGATYTIHVQSDDGARLWIDGAVVVDNWDSRGWRSGGRGASTELAAGRHAVRIEHMDRKGAAALRVTWTGGPVPPYSIMGAPDVTKP